MKICQGTCNNNIYNFKKKAFRSLLTKTDLWATDLQFSYHAIAFPLSSSFHNLPSLQNFTKYTTLSFLFLLWCISQHGKAEFMVEWNSPKVTGVDFNFRHYSQLFISLRYKFPLKFHFYIELSFIKIHQVLCCSITTCNNSIQKKRNS